MKQDTTDGIRQVLSSLMELLVVKNNLYGDSALKPINIFNKDGAENSILVRLDDKLSRIKNSKDLRVNDVSDLMGYLTLLCIERGWMSFDRLID